MHPPSGKPIGGKRQVGCRTINGVERIPGAPDGDPSRDMCKEKDHREKEERPRSRGLPTRKSGKRARTQEDPESRPDGVPCDRAEYKSRGLEGSVSIEPGAISQAGSHSTDCSPRNAIEVDSADGKSRARRTCLRDFIQAEVAESVLGE